MSKRVSCRVTYGHIAGYGFSGRGYAVYVNGEQVTPICGHQRAAWAAYRRLSN